MAPFIVPNRTDPCVGVEISPGCLITSEPETREREEIYKTTITGVHSSWIKITSESTSITSLKPTHQPVS